MNKFFISTIIMFLSLMILCVFCYNNGYKKGCAETKQHILFDSEISVEDNSVLIDIDGDVYEHLVG